MINCVTVQYACEMIASNVHLTMGIKLSYSYVQHKI